MDSQFTVGTSVDAMHWQLLPLQGVAVKKLTREHSENSPNGPHRASGLARCMQDRYTHCARAICTLAMIETPAARIDSMNSCFIYEPLHMHVGCTSYSYRILLLESHKCRLLVILVVSVPW